MEAVLLAFDFRKLVWGGKKHPNQKIPMLAAFTTFPFSVFMQP